MHGTTVKKYEDFVMTKESRNKDMLSAKWECQPLHDEVLY